MNYVQQRLKGDALELPSKPQGAAIGGKWWITYCDEDLFGLSMEVEALWAALWYWRGQEPVKAARFLQPSGEVDRHLPGTLRVRARCGKLRREWVAGWRELGVPVLGGDTCLSRYLNAKLLSCWVAQMPSAVCEWRSGEWAVPEYSAVFNSVCSAGDLEAVKNTGLVAQQQWIGWVRTTFEGATVRGAAKQLVGALGPFLQALEMLPVERGEGWVGREGEADLLRAVLSCSGRVEGVDWERVEMRRACGRIMRQVAELDLCGSTFGVHLLKGHKGGDGALGGGAVNDKALPLGALAKAVDAGAEAQLSSTVRQAWQVWSRDHAMELTALLESGPRRDCEAGVQMGMRLGVRVRAGAVRELGEGWAKEAARQLVLGDGEGMEPSQVEAQVVVLTRLVLAQVRSVMAANPGCGRVIARLVGDDTHGERPGYPWGAEELWDETEAKARESLEREPCERGKGRREAGKIEPLDWGNVQGARSWWKQWDCDIWARKSPEYMKLLEDWAGLRARFSWLAGVNDVWARGVVSWEGAMRAYLRHVGMGIGDGTQEGMGAFWRGIGSGDLGAVPAWRWELLREAYLAAWVWGGAEVLAGWAPLDPRHVVRMRDGLASCSGVVGGFSRTSGKVWGGVAAWDGNRLEARSDWPPGAVVPFRMAGVESLWRIWDEHPERGLLFGGRLFGAGVLGLNELPVGGAPLIPPEEAWRKGLKLGMFVLDHGVWKLGAGGGLWLGVKDVSQGRGVQAWVNLCLAGQSRYGALHVGEKFRRWLESTGQDPKLARVWAQWGYWGTKEWSQSPGLAPLFAGCEPDDAFTLFQLGGLVPGPDNFALWRGLGEGIRKVWGMVEKAPLSFPMLSMARIGSTPMAPSAPLLWWDRVVRAIGRGVDPVRLRPWAEMPGVVGKDAGEFGRWRQRIWAPMYVGALGLTTRSGTSEWETPNGGQMLRAPVRRVWEEWCKPWMRKGGGEPG